MWIMITIACFICGQMLFCWYDRIKSRETWKLKKEVSKIYSQKLELERIFKDRRHDGYNSLCDLYSKIKELEQEEKELRDKIKFINDSNYLKNSMLNLSYQLIYERFLVKAETCFNEEEYVDKIIEESADIHIRLNKYSNIDESLKYICNLNGIISDYIHKRYTGINSASIITIFAGILYFVCAFDAIADFIPMIGLVDDAAIVSFVIKSEQNEIAKYLKWKEKSEHSIDEQKRQRKERYCIGLCSICNRDSCVLDE